MGLRGCVIWFHVVLLILWDRMGFQRDLMGFSWILWDVMEFNEDLVADLLGFKEDSIEFAGI